MKSEWLEIASEAACALFAPIIAMAVAAALALLLGAIR